MSIPNPGDEFIKHAFTPPQKPDTEEIKRAAKSATKPIEERLAVIEQKLDAILELLRKP